MLNQIIFANAENCCVSVTTIIIQFNFNASFGVDIRISKSAQQRNV